MFENLIESKPKKERTIGQTILSVVVHAALIVGAIKATQGAAGIVQEKIAAQADFVLNEPPPPPPPPPDQPQPTVVATNPPPQGFQTIMPPRDLPTEIPPVNLNEKFDARDFSGRGVEGGVAKGIVGGTGPVITDNIVGSESFTVDQVDDPATVIGGTMPAYPDVMKSVGIEGVVRLRFVVGVNGRVESNTIQVVSSSNKAFEAAAVNGIQKVIFKPAKMRGQAVRQLVEQNIKFSLSS